MTTSTELTRTEAARLAELEATVERALSSFVEVANALREIRDSLLYRKTHQTFEAYCRERWAFSKQYAYLVIAEAEVNQLVDSPIRQAQARELVPLLNEPEKLQQAWERAADNGIPPTAARIREEVQKEKRRPRIPARLREKQERDEFGAALQRLIADARQVQRRAARAGAISTDAEKAAWYGHIGTLRGVVNEIQTAMKEAGK